jgi:SsrA-binding protein
MRSRKLLLHREQIRKLQERMAKERLTLVPLSMLLKNGRIKVELALAKGRQKEDRRQAIAERHYPIIGQAIWFALAQQRRLEK